MFNQNHVRRNPNTHSQRYTDARMHSNPQAIPRNQNHMPIQRGNSSNYSPYNTHGQSPQPSHQFIAPGYTPIATDINTHSGSSGGKPHANGQFVWSNPQQRMPYQGHSQQGQFQAYPQGINPNSQIVYLPATHSVSSRFPAHQIPPHRPHQMQGNPPAYFTGPQAFYSSQVAPVPGAYGQSYDPAYPPANQQTIHPSAMTSNPPAPSSAPAPRKKVITIKDPDTMEDVTSDVLHSGKRTESESSSGQPPASPVTVVTTQQEHIAAQFAAQVAAAATESLDRIKPADPSEVNSNFPRVVDTSVPPPSLQTISHTLPLSTAPKQNASKAIDNTSKVANGVTTASEINSMTNGATISSQRVKGNSLRPEPPLAVVQPMPNAARSAAQRDAKNKVAPSVPKIEKILSRGEALPPLKDSKTDVSIEPDGAFIAVKDVGKCENLSSEQGAVIKTSQEAKPEPEPELQYLEMAESSSPVAAVNVETKTVKKEVAAISKPTAAPSSTGATLEMNGVNGANIIDDKDVVATAKAAVEPTETDENASDRDAKVLSGGDSIAEVPFKPTEPVSDSKPAEPMSDSKPVEPVPDSKTPSSKLNETAPVKNASIGSSQSSRDMKSQTSRDDSKDKEAIDIGSKEGSKMVYDRDFIMKCREHSSTREKPDNLPDIDIIMDQCLTQIPTGLPSLGFGGTDFTPGWMVGRNRMERQMSRGSQGSNQSRQGYYNQQSQKVVKKVSIQREPEPELSKAENAWKPSKLENTNQTPKQSEEAKTEEILKNVRAILNKLTPQKFTDLMKKFMQLPINTENRLREVINLIFEKAIDEPNFCEAYANMCRVMSQHSVSTPSGEAGLPADQSNPVIFRKVLLTRCQKEFEKDGSTETVLDDLRKKVEQAKAEEKQQLKEELETRESKERRRVLGNIRFIGELFKLQMLTEAIMHNCIMSLFRAHDEEKLESLCRLLTTIGRILDHVKGKARMDQYFSQIDKIITERKISSRVKFMLKDVVDLRRCNWVQRAIKAQGPKTIDQIRQDVKEEKEQLAFKTAQTSSGPPVKSQSRGNRMGSRNSSSHNLSEDGWTNVSQKPMRIDPQKMKFSKENTKIDENVALIPNRGKQGWKSGSGSITKTGSGSFQYRDTLEGGIGSRATPTTKNRFSALVGGSGGMEYSHRAGGRVSSQERSKSGSRGSSVSNEYRNSGRNERQMVLETARRLTSNEKKPPSKGYPPVPKLVSEPKFDLAAVTKKINSTVNEYLHLNDVKEATECFDEMKIPSGMGHVIVKGCLETSLEKSSKDRSSVSSLLAYLVKNNKLRPDQLIKGVVNNMEVAIDLELDLPKVWSCVAEQTAAVFHSSNNKVGLHCLKEMAAPLLEVNKADVFVAELLKRLVEETGKSEAIQSWKNSNLNFDYFVQSTDPARITSFLEKHNLQSFHGTDLKFEATKPKLKLFEFNDLVSAITKQLDKHSNHDPIFDWIESNVSLSNQIQSDFVSALITAVSNKAIIQVESGALEVDKPRMCSRSILLKKFVDEAKELEAVYALQKLFIDLEQPPNVLKVLFDCLYDEDVISEQTFFQWEQAEDQSEGKGVALLSVKPFLTWLRQAEVESDD